VAVTIRADEMECDLYRLSRHSAAPAFEIAERFACLDMLDGPIEDICSGCAERLAITTERTR